jgi:hypothetical protein
MYCTTHLTHKVKNSCQTRQHVTLGFLTQFSYCHQGSLSEIILRIKLFTEVILIPFSNSLHNSTHYPIYVMSPFIQSKNNGCQLQLVSGIILLLWVYSLRIKCNPSLFLHQLHQIPPWTHHCILLKVFPPFSRFHVKGLLLFVSDESEMIHEKTTF